MSDPDIYDEVDDDEPKRKGSWEYVHCNWVWVPEYEEENER